MASRLITDLKNIAGIACAKHVDLMHANKINFLITCTYRSNEEQDALYNLGRKPKGIGKIVTNAKAGESAHNYGLAYDIAILIDGKLNWDLSHPQWKLAGKLGEQVENLEWLGSPGSKFKEGAHFQVKNWVSYINK